MDLEQLRTVVEVAEAGSLSAAAKTRNLTQPAVSLQMKALEEELGTPLFHRGGRGVTLTTAGTAVLARAREVLSLVRTARAEVAEIRGLEQGVVRLGATDAAATGILTPAFVSFHRLHPRIGVEVEVDSTEVLVAGVRQGRFDFALGTLPVEDGYVHAETLVVERLGIVLPTPLGRKTLASVLEEERFIAYPRGSITRRLIDQALEESGLRVRPVMEIGRPEIMARLVAAGLGVSVLPEGMGGRSPSAGLASVSFRRFVVHRRLGLLMPRNRILEPAARAFTRVLRTPKPDS